MVFEQMRKQMKWIIAAVAVAFAVTLLYVGGPAFFHGQEAAGAVIARIEGQALDEATFSQALFEQIQVYEQLRGAVRPSDMEEVRYQTLEQIIANRLLVKAAREEGITVSGREVDQRLAEVRDAFPSREEFNRALRQRNMNEGDLRRAIEEGLLAEKLHAKIAGGVKVTPEEVAQAYEQVHAWQILVTPSGTDTAAWRKAETQTRELVAQLRRGGDFAALARKYSQDAGTKDKGGDLGFVGHGTLAPELDKVVFSLDVGAVSDPIKTAQGYHIVRVTEHRQPKGPEFEKARADLEAQLKQEKGNEAFAEWFRQYRLQAKVEVLDPQLAAREAVARGDLEGALKLYQQAAAANVSDPYAHYGAARVLSTLNRPDDALAQLQKAAELGESDPVLQWALGMAYRERGDKAKAAEYLRKASELSPMDLAMHQYLYAIFQSMGLKEDAAAEQQQLEKIQKVMEEQRKVQEELARRLQEQQAQQQAPKAGTPAEPATPEAPSQPAQPAPQGAAPPEQPSAGSSGSRAGAP